MGLLDRLQQAGGQRHAYASQAITGSPYEIWGQRGWPNVDVVGESFYTKAIRALLGPASLPTEGAELTTQVHLVHNSLNPHDRNAIEVHASTGLLGHLSREDAARYAPVIEDLQQGGLIATTTARIWGRDQEDWDTSKQMFVGSVRVDLPDPHMMVPRNQPPAEPHQLLPSGSAIRVSAVDGSSDATGPYLCREGECWVHATIHEVVAQRPRSSKQLAELRIDGRAVGRLTPKMSSDMLPAVQFISDRGFLTAVRAVVKGNQLKCEVVVYAARAAELPQEWFNALPSTARPAVTSAAATLESATTSAEPVSDVASDEMPSSATQSAPAADVGVAPPLAWYPDPHGVARLRWWNGTAWTEHTAP
jgi:Protein of unknown function (DUF2510)/HIRAN domain